MSKDKQTPFGRREVAAQAAAPIPGQMPSVKTAAMAGGERRRDEMAVELYFGLPGAGKTTLLCYKAAQAKKSKRYKHIYSNVRLKMDGVTYIDNDCIGKYALRECLLLIDEATLFADSRGHKTFDMGKITYFLEHRHMRADVILFTQQWDGVDKKIRVITDRVYYVYKGRFTGKWFTRCYRIPYGIIIPDPKKDGSEKLGEIVQGYCKPNLFVRLFSPWLFRPTYYKYFDSWEEPYFPELPDSYKPYKDADGAREPKAARAVRIYYQTYIDPEPIPKEFQYMAS